MAAEAAVGRSDTDFRAQRPPCRWTKEHASERGDFEAEHAIYAADAVLDYPQSGERFRGREKIAAQCGGHPADRHFTVLRITGQAHVWVSECVITYDGAPSYSVSVMEFADQQVVHETQYIAAPLGTPAWRAALAEPMPGEPLRMPDRPRPARPTCRISAIAHARRTPPGHQAGLPSPAVCVVRKRAR
jgi:hypothetical protein